MRKLLVPTILLFYAQGPAHAWTYPQVEGEVVVKLRPGQLSKFRIQKSDETIIKKEMKLLAGDFVLVESQTKSTQALMNELKIMPEILYAEPNYLYKAISADPLFEKLWGLNNTGTNEPGKDGQYTGTQGVPEADINAEKAWQITKGSKSVVIAIIDTGIDYNHPDLKDNIWVNSKEIAGNGIDDDQNGFVDDIHGWNFQKNMNNPMDGNSHGTHCAGTIGGKHNNGIGVAGVMNDVQLMAVKFLGDDGSGSLTDAVEAIDYATKMNVDIMSNSWGGGGYSQALEDAIKAAKNRGILFVAAAGNDGTNNDTRPHYPSNYQLDNVISVASHTNSDNLSGFSCFGRKTVHVAAPGSNIYSSTPNNKYAVYSGTSMATPHVSGVLGLLIAKEGRQDVLTVRNRLMATTVPNSAYKRKILGGGRVDAYNLLTDTRPPHTGPDESAWKKVALPGVFESTHPYGNNIKVSRSFTLPGAKYIKVILEKYETEPDYDFIILRDAQGNLIEKVSGKGEGYETDYVEGDTFILEFNSDGSQVGYGVKVQEVKVIY